MKKIILIVLIIANQNAFCQNEIKIYYNNDCQIIMKELASHYRIGHVDTIKKVFTGKVVDYTMDGEIICSINYDKEGKKNGEYLEYYDNGNLKIKGNYLNNSKSGSWTYYYSNGKIHQTIEFIENDFKVIEQIDGSGQATVKNGNGIWSSIRENGILKGLVENGYKEGKWTFESLEGNLIGYEIYESGRFIKGKFSGERRYTQSFEPIFFKYPCLISKKE